MQKQSTINIDENIYRRLCQRIGKGKISQFIEDLVKPYLVKEKREEASDRFRDLENLAWSEATF